MTVEKYYCDICEEEIRDKKDMNFINLLYLPKNSDFLPGTPGKRYDICICCSGKVIANIELLKETYIYYEEDTSIIWDDNTYLDCKEDAKRSMDFYETHNPWMKNKK